MAYLDLTARAVLVVVFLAATASKWRDLGAFRGAIHELSLPRPALVAAAVAGAEAGVVLLLVIPATFVLGYALAVGLLTAFSLGIARAIRRGQAVRCRCFGAHGSVLRGHHIVRNGIVVTTAVLGWLAHTAPSPIETIGYGELLAVAAGVLGAILIVFWDDLVFVFAAPAGRPGATRRP